MPTTALRWWWSTAPRMGAIAIAHLSGEAAALERALQTLTGRSAPAVGAVSWRRFGDIDDGLVARVGIGHALLMPHGGRRIGALLQEQMKALGVVMESEAFDCVDAIAPARACELYPEAGDPIEAMMLATLARAASPLAIDLLAAQPQRWRDGAAGSGPIAESQTSARDRRLRRLIDPPRVVVTGPANAGKSTLLNTLAGRTVAIAHDAPGTTRDAVAARIELGGVVVDWFDTPGVRPEADAIEMAAALLAEHALATADLIVHLSAPGLGWGAIHTAGPRADADQTHPRPLRILNKCDLPEATHCSEARDATLKIGAASGQGIPALVTFIRDALVHPEDVQCVRPWRFADGLEYGRRG